MKTQHKTKKTLLKDGSHQLLNLKELLDQIMHEGETLPKEVKEAIAQARNIAWEFFIKEHTRINELTK